MASILEHTEDSRFVSSADAPQRHPHPWLRDHRLWDGCRITQTGGKKFPRE